MDFTSEVTNPGKEHRQHRHNLPLVPVVPAHTPWLPRSMFLVSQCRRGGDEASIPPQCYDIWRSWFPSSSSHPSGSTPPPPHPPWNWHDKEHPSWTYISLEDVAVSDEWWDRDKVDMPIQYICSRFRVPPCKFNRGIASTWFIYCGFISQDLGSESPASVCGQWKQFSHSAALGCDHLRWSHYSSFDFHILLST